MGDGMIRRVCKNRVTVVKKGIEDEGVWQCVINLAYNRERRRTAGRVSEERETL